jgi:hypothetical protein
MRPTLRALLRAYDNADPAPKRQKAITPKLLRFLFQSTGLATTTLRDSAPAVMADITIAGFFFAMRSCEYSATPVPGKTKIIILSGIIFRTATKQLINPTNPILLVLAQYVTITFVDQQKLARKWIPGPSNEPTTHSYARYYHTYPSSNESIDSSKIGLHKLKSTPSVSRTQHYA